MDKNILYQNLDMLSVMEACEDKSKDFILLFMPTTMGGTVGESSRQRKISPEYDKWYNENAREYADFGRLLLKGYQYGGKWKKESSCR